MLFPKSILVTGGAGFIGANFIRYLSSQTDAVIINLDRLTYAANLDYLNQAPTPNYKLVEGSITDSQLVEQLFVDYDFDCVIHFAAESHVDRSIAGPMAFIDTNINGTAVLLESARKYWQAKNFQHVRFHHVSTDEVFGSLELGDPAFSEKTAYDPSSPYSASKAASDHLLRAWHRTYGLPITISNCSNNYGAGQNVEKLIPSTIEKALTGQKITIYGDGTNRRDWLYVLDHCEAIWQIVQRGRDGETYAVGGGAELSNNEVVQTICTQLDQLFPDKAPHASLIDFVTDRAGHDWRYAIDASKIRDELGWSPKYSFAEAIQTTITDYIKQNK